MKNLFRVAVAMLLTMVTAEAAEKQSSVVNSHIDPQQIKSIECVDAMLQKLTDSDVATQAEVAFQIEYLNRIKVLRKECSSSDLFGQRLLTSYPKLGGVESIAKLSKSLYPDEQVDPIKEEVRARMQDYFDVVSNLDFELARNLWAAEGDVSIIAPRGQFFGVESISNDFLKRSFSSFQYRKLSSLNEVINVYGNSSANVQLYWKFDTKDAKGVAHTGMGRETLIFEKIDNTWRLVHVHYSRMPE